MTIIVEINNVEEKQCIKDEECPNWVYENINKADKPVQPNQEYVGEQISLSEMKKGDDTKTLSTDIKMIRRIS